MDNDDIIIDVTENFTKSMIPKIPVWVIVLIAEACHENNRIWTEINGLGIMKPWDETTTEHKRSVIEGVTGVIKGNGPEESHKSWMNNKLENGWKYGPEKNETIKEHNCLVPYNELPEAQRLKDDIFVSTVKSMVGAYEQSK